MSTRTHTHQKPEDEGQNRSPETEHIETSRILSLANRVSNSILARIVSFEQVVCTFWVLFWFSNGLDKFMNSDDAHLLTLYGIDRSVHITDYFEFGRVPSEVIRGIFWAIGIWEETLALLFLIAAIYYFKANQFDESERRGLITLALLLSGITFMLFTLFDTVVGDRSMLARHGTFFGIVVASWLAVAHRSYWQTP